MSKQAHTRAQRVAHLLSLLGGDVVLLPIPSGKKRPTDCKWQKRSTAVMRNARYLKRLEIGNVGVSLGAPSNGLCSIDIDCDEFVEPFLACNPSLRDTLRTKGERGCNLWVQIVGNYPALTSLEFARPDANGNKKKWGEWRATGGQTVIAGKHPSGCNYRIEVEAKPARIAFDAIKWPPELRLPWQLSLYDKVVQEVGPPYFVGPFGTVTLNQRFFVEKFAQEHLILHEPEEHEFYDYEESSGLWRRETADRLKSMLAADLKAYADTQPINLVKKITNGFLDQLVGLLRGHVEKKQVFIRGNGRIHVGNGVLHVRETPPFVTEFSPKFYSRNRSPINFVEGAQCPKFINQLLANALSPEDISLLQRYCGSLLLGCNRAQRIAIFMGLAASGNQRSSKSSRALSASKT